jgi:hypothetical protein
MHETAHALTDDMYAAHGPEFVSTYIQLLGQYCRISAKTLRRTAIDMGVDVA